MYSLKSRNKFQSYFYQPVKQNKHLNRKQQVQINHINTSKTNKSPKRKIL